MLRSRVGMKSYMNLWTKESCRFLAIKRKLVCSGPFLRLSCCGSRTYTPYGLQPTNRPGVQARASNDTKGSVPTGGSRSDGNDKKFDSEIASIALPLLVTLAADPLAGLVETAFVGRLGAVELAGMAVALSIFNTIAKLLNIPLISSTTTLVAQASGMAGQRRSESRGSSGTRGQTEELAQAGTERADASPSNIAAAGEGSELKRVDQTYHQGRGSPPASSASPGGAINGSSRSSTSQAGADAKADKAQDLKEPDQMEGRPENALSVATSAAIMMAVIVGVLEAVAIWNGAGPALSLWGVSSSSNMRDAFEPALDFLRIRALGAPVQVLMLTLQGVFRGIQDARTPLKFSLATNVVNIILAPIFIYGLDWGVRGAAAALVVAQAVPTSYLLYLASQRIPLNLTGRETLIQLAGLAGPSGWLILRSMGTTLTYAFATSVVARSGSVYAAAHQVCFQLWLATSLTADALAIALQSLLAKNIASGDVEAGRELIRRSGYWAIMLGLGLAFFMAIFQHAFPKIFSSDPHVLALAASVMPVVVLTQPINALAFVGDGMLFGIGAFKYASASMVLSSLPAILLIALAVTEVDPRLSLVYVWLGLGGLMLMRLATIGVLPALVQLPRFRSLPVCEDNWKKDEGSTSLRIISGKGEARLWRWSGLERLIARVGGKMAQGK